MLHGWASPDPWPGQDSGLEGWGGGQRFGEGLDEEEGVRQVRWGIA